MIPITQEPEPSDFDEKVRQPGLSAIDELVGRPSRIKRRVAELRRQEQIIREEIQTLG